MKSLFSTIVLGALLLASGCAHHSKCGGGQCDVKKSDCKSCCDSKSSSQCDMKKHKKKEEKKS